MIEAKTDPLDLFVSTEPDLELNAETDRVLDERIASSNAGHFVSAQEARQRIQEWLFKIRYNKDALADLEGIFSWSLDHHPETTEDFMRNLFDRLDMLASFPYVGSFHQRTI